MRGHQSRDYWCPYPRGEYGGRQQKRGKEGPVFEGSSIGGQDLLEELNANLPNSVEHLAHGQVRHTLGCGINNEPNGDGGYGDAEGLEATVHISSLC